MDFSQSNGGPLVGHLSSKPVSPEMPFPDGPRKRGQSSPVPSAANEEDAANEPITHAMIPKLNQALTAETQRAQQSLAKRLECVRLAGPVARLCGSKAGTSSTHSKRFARLGRHSKHPRSLRTPKIQVGHCSSVILCSLSYGHWSFPLLSPRA